MKITINNQEFNLKFSFKAHKELTAIIKESGKDAIEYLSVENYPTMVQIALKHGGHDMTIEQVEELLDTCNHKQVQQLVSPVIDYFSPNE